MFNKRGISPLIATVLIIGFTIALAAIIITWGASFTKTMQTQTEETAERQVICSTEVMIDVKNAQVIVGNQIRMLIENGGGIEIDKFNIRIYGSNGTASEELNSSLDAYGIQSFKVPFDPTIIGEVEEIEAFPSITLGGDSVVCSNCYDKEMVRACESWTCTAWSTCPPEGIQIRTCTDDNECGTTVGKPPEEQSCICTEVWSCGDWGTCTGGATGTQTRECTDANNCGTTVNQPAEEQNCCEEVWSCTAWGSCIGSGETGTQTRTCTDGSGCGTTVNQPPEEQSCSRIIFNDPFDTLSTADWEIYPGGDVQSVNGELRIVGQGESCVWCSSFWSTVTYDRSRNPTLKLDFKVNTVSTDTIFHIGTEGVGVGSEPCTWGELNGYRRYVIVVRDGYITSQMLDGGVYVAGDCAEYQTLVDPVYADTWYTLEIDFDSSGSRIYVYEREQSRPSTPLHTMTQADWNPYFRFWIYQETGYIDNAIVFSDWTPT